MQRHPSESTATNYYYMYRNGYNNIPCCSVPFHTIPCSAFDAITVQYYKLLHSQGINHERASRTDPAFAWNLYPSKTWNAFTALQFFFIVIFAGFWKICVYKTMVITHRAVLLLNSELNCHRSHIVAAHSKLLLLLRTHWSELWCECVCI